MLHHCCETGADQETSPAVSLLHFYRWWHRFNDYHDDRDEDNNDNGDGDDAAADADDDEVNVDDGGVSRLLYFQLGQLHAYM